MQHWQIGLNAVIGQPTLWAADLSQHFIPSFLQRIGIRESRASDGAERAGFELPVHEEQAVADQVECAYLVAKIVQRLRFLVSAKAAARCGAKLRALC